MTLECDEAEHTVADADPWIAVARRHRGYRGAFVQAVRTTGAYGRRCSPLAASADQEPHLDTPPSPPHIA